MEAVAPPVKGLRTNRPRLVGDFIRQRRETLGISQRSLGLLFNPAVTTQFISNVERGVTPLPPAHVPVLAHALQVTEAEVMSLLEREYTMKLSGRLGRSEASTDPNRLEINGPDSPFIKSVYQAYQSADDKTREAFATICESILHIRKTGS
jgi:transcriptional regulator with XRE-family HTH domain